jgi:short-subunit dehydrogenase
VWKEATADNRDISVLFSNAGVCNYELLHDMAVKTIQREAMLNVFGNVYLNKLATEHFASRAGHSAVITTASNNALFPYPHLASYAGTKRFLFNLAME